MPRKIETNRKRASGPKLRQISNGIVHSKCSLKKKLARIVFFFAATPLSKNFPALLQEHIFILETSATRPAPALLVVSFARKFVPAPPCITHPSHKIFLIGDTGMDQPLADPYPNFAFWNIWDGKLGCFEA